MIRAIAIAMLAFTMPAAAAHEVKPASRPAVLVAGLGAHHHPVSTKNTKAQRFFDQGLSYVFAFNHDEAVRSFQHAAELDPRLAIAHWGVALALGPNINDEITPERERQALAALARAQVLAANASEQERAYIGALAKRYSSDPQARRPALDTAYKEAMGELVRRYPDDLDAAVLYAESAMDLRPWKLWTPDGKPEPGTEDIVAVLEGVLKRNPNHSGAIHYYVHAVEASPDPGRALPYARQLGALAPAAGHLVHMPAHIQVRVGDYRAAAASNEAAIRADRAYLRSGAQGLYPVMYLSHNLHFLAYAEAMAGRYRAARRAADALVRHLEPVAKEQPMADPFMATPLLIDVKFGRWDAILRAGEPAFELQQTAVIWHFARGMAYAATGDAERAQTEHEAFRKAQETLPKDAAMGLNDARTVFRIADALLAARIGQAHGQPAPAIEALRQAASVEDRLAYDEPPGWYLPVREALGAAYFRERDYAAAEQAFRDDLERHPSNGRSLYGLALALRAQGKSQEAAAARTAQLQAWRGADTVLSMQRM